MQRTRTSLLALPALLAALLLLPACGGGSSVEVPETPEGTVQELFNSLAENKPEYLWAAMPESYQKDVDSLIQEFAGKVDKEVYDKTFVVLNKLGDVLTKQKEFILNSPMTQMAPVDKASLSKNWDEAVGIVNTIAKSDIRSVDSLKNLDVAKFLRTTGSKVMAHAQTLSAAAGEEADLWGKMKKAKVEVVSSEGDNATLKITGPDGEVDEEQFVKVEGRWIPKEMADEWKDRIAEAKAGIQEMTSSENKMGVMMGLAAVEGGLDALASAKTQEEFNAAIGSLMGGMMGGGPGGPGGGMGGPGGPGGPSGF